MNPLYIILPFTGPEINQKFAQTRFVSNQKGIRRQNDLPCGSEGDEAADGPPKGTAVVDYRCE